MKITFELAPNNIEFIKTINNIDDFLNNFINEKRHQRTKYEKLLIESYYKGSPSEFIQYLKNIKYIDEAKWFELKDAGFWDYEKGSVK